MPDSLTTAEADELLHGSHLRFLCLDDEIGDLLIDIGALLAQAGKARVDIGTGSPSNAYLFIASHPFLMQPRLHPFQPYQLARHPTRESR